DPVGFPLPRTAPGSGFDLPALRARCSRQASRTAYRRQGALRGILRILRTEGLSRRRSDVETTIRQVGGSLVGGVRPDAGLPTRHNAAYRALARTDGLAKRNLPRRSLERSGQVVTGRDFFHIPWRQAELLEERYLQR